MTELVKVDPDLTALANSVPDDIREGVMRLVQTIQPPKEGFGDMDMESMRFNPPTIRIKQPVSTKAPDNARNGDLYSNDTGEVIKRPFRFIPVFPFENRVKFGEGGAKIECSSEDRVNSRNGTRCDVCPDRPWKDGKLQKCQDNLNLYVVTEDYKQMYHLLFSKTSLATGKSIIQQIRNLGCLPWHCLYSLTTEETKNPNSVGLYYVYRAQFTNERTPEAFHPVGAAIHNALLAKRQQQKAELLSKIDSARTTIDAKVEEVVGTQADLSDM